MPKQYDNIIQFHSLKVPFAIYAVFECMLQKFETCQPYDETSYTNAYQKYVPNNFVFHIKYSNGDYKSPVENSGVHAPRLFYQNVK